MSEALLEAYRRLRLAWDRQGGLPIATRRAALKRLRDAVKANADAFVRTLDADFGRRSREETLIAEVAAVLRAVDHARPRLARWAAAERIPIGWPFWPARAETRKQPLGVAGILGPSNFPVQLTLLPLIGAVAAGCRVLVKPSELTPATAELLGAVMREAFPDDVVQCVQGGADVAAGMTGLPLDHLLFTGSSANGRKVMAAAAPNLTRLTLELGGKSPAVLAPDADLARAAHAIIAGKLLNAGQTCVAPDYVLVPRPLLQPFLGAACDAAQALYPQVEGLTRVRGEAARLRLDGLREGLRCMPLLKASVGSSEIEPALVLEPPLSSAIMREEIFGPLLPVLAYDDASDAIAVINSLPHALAIYWFGQDRGPLDHLLARTSSGAVAVNETVLQAAVETFPLGGVGASGFGSYHGKAGFDAFSHHRPVFFQSRFTLPRLIRPPYGRHAQRIIDLMLR